jgi:acetyl esterase/lipase
VVAKFVRNTGIAALLYEYRLAPEHPFPATIDDTLTVYKWLLAQGTLPSKVVIVGESAGGGLCLAALLAFRDECLPLPSAGVAISPWTDLLCTGESYRTNASKCMSPDGTWTAFSRHYAGEHNAGHPWISPLYGDLAGLPPLMIYVGGDEILRDDSVQFAERAKAAGVDVTLRIGEHMCHCYPVLAPMFPEATKAMNEICGFIRKKAANTD